MANLDQISTAAPNAVVLVQAAGGDAVRIGNQERLSVIAGPCQLESRDHALEVAHALKEIAGRLGIGLVFKTSFDKANRTSANAQRGIGLMDALPMCTRSSNAPSPRVRSICCRFPPFCAARPIC
jgi:2-dehydro-3-deoxyphosphooctonate aldolase (KDO 8-P synthase)